MAQAHTFTVRQTLRSTWFSFFIVRTSFLASLTAFLRSLQARHTPSPQVPIYADSLAVCLRVGCLPHRLSSAVSPLRLVVLTSGSCSRSPSGIGGGAPRDPDDAPT